MTRFTVRGPCGACCRAALRRVLQSSVETLVARTILRGDISAGSTITVDARDGELVVV